MLKNILIIVKPEMVLWYLILTQNVKMLLDNKALLRILHAYLVIFQTLICLNSEGPIYIYKCSVKTYIVDNKKIFASVKTKYTIQNISIKLQCQKY